ncbi:MAG: dipeptidase [Anaerolineae bacterium]|nr:dipeptidase [Phycisphaerae bacterium]
MTEQIRQVDDYLQRTHRDAVAALLDVLRIASISTQPDHAGDVHAAARWTADYLNRIGLKSEIWQTAGHPAVFAEKSESANAPTILIYGHHDVQPTGDLSRWSSPPFEPRVDANGRIVARGSADNKGQFFLQILAVEAWLKTAGRLPVNVKFLIEGEEEIGSPNLPGLLRERIDRLRCDLVVVSDTPLWRANRPAISLGTRGITGLEVKITGPNRDLHSGMYGGSVPNPIDVLCRMIAQLHDDRGRVTVPEFYDDVKPIPADLRGEWRRLDAGVQDDARKLDCALVGEDGFNTLERRWLRPTLEFNGITGGYQGPGSNTIVPSTASAKITCRLVPDQDPVKIQNALRDHLKSLAPGGVKVDFIMRKMGSPAYSIDADHPALQAAARVFKEVYGVDPVRIREGVTLPILPAFRSILGAETVLLGFCDPECQAHSFDEFFDSRDLLLGARTAARFFDAISSNHSR